MPTSPTRRPLDVRAQPCPHTKVAEKLNVPESKVGGCNLCNGSGWVLPTREPHESITRYLPIPADDPEAWVGLFTDGNGWHWRIEGVELTADMCLDNGPYPTPDAAYYAAVCKVEGWKLTWFETLGGGRRYFLHSAASDDLIANALEDPLTALRAAKEAKEQ